MIRRLSLVLFLAAVPAVLGAFGCLGAAEHCTKCGARSDGGLDAPVVDHPATGGSGGSGGGGGGSGGVGGSLGGAGGGAGTGGAAPDATAPPDLPVETGGGQPEVAAEVRAEMPPPPNPNLVAFYAFDQTTGTTAIDSSGNGHDAPLVGGATFAAGMVRNDLSLNGTTGYVDVPDNMLNNARELTIAAWVRVRTDKGWQRIFDFGSSATVNMFLTPHAAVNATTNFLRFTITTGGIATEQHLDGTAVLPTAVWKHVAVVLGAAPAGGTLYLDGALLVSNAAMSLRPADLGATVNNWIGRSQYPVDPYFDGEIDEFRIYDRALSAAEITALFMLR